jgi:hypothetical protein
MPKITVSWDDDAQTAIRWDIPGEVEKPDFHKALQQSQQMMTSQSHTVHIIINPQQGANPPRGAIAMFKNAGETAPPNQGFTVIVGSGDAYPRLLLVTFNRIYKHLSEKIRFVTTLDEAREFLQAEALKV